MPKNFIRLEDFTQPPSPKASDLPRIQQRMSRLNMKMSVLDVSDPGYEIYLEEFLHLSDQYLLAKKKVI